MCVCVGGSSLHFLQMSFHIVAMSVVLCDHQFICGDDPLREREIPVEQQQRRTKIPLQGVSWTERL